jgi:hypothetical protein
VAGAHCTPTSTLTGTQACVINIDTPGGSGLRSPHKLRDSEWKRVPVPVATPDSGHQLVSSRPRNMTFSHVTYSNSDNVSNIVDFTR